MAALFDDEGNQGTYQNDDNDISSPRSQYSFPALKDWLSKYGLSHLESALKDEEFESLHSLIMLNASDLDELCNELKQNLKQKNSKLSLKEKATFKREIIQQQLLYNEFLSGLKSNDNKNNNNQNENASQSFVVTKEERQALQTLNQMIKILETASNLSQNVTNNAKQLHSPIIMSISQISKQLELFLNKLFQIAYDKYMKGHNDFSTDCQKALTTLKNTKQSCYDSLSMESNEQLDVVKRIEDITKKVGQGRRDFARQFADDFFEKECFSALLTTLLDDINIAKMVQQLIPFILSQLRPTIKIIVQMEEGPAMSKKKEGENHNVLLLILPHAIDYVQDIENELKERNIKIVKKHDNITNDDAIKLLMKQWSSLIHRKYGEDEEKSFVMDSEKDTFEIFRKGPLEKNAQIWVWRHLNKYFKTAANQCAAWNIELKYGGKHHFENVHDFISDNFDICYPSILGEYSSTFFPDTINGKLIKLWRSKHDEKKLNAQINLGFIDVISPQFVKEVLNLDISD